MSDGHCASTSEVIFVQFSASGCTGADGSAAMPYCAPNDAVATLTASRHVIVIVGATAAGMILNTMNKAPIVVGRKDTGGNVGSILAGPTTAIAISSDTVLLRDLTVNAGTISTSKGITVSGAGTNVTLLRVTANLMTAGLGVDAESGTTLSMDECYVTNNPAGGLLINGASYKIQNTVIAGNSVGVKFSASAISTGSEFWFNTVVGNTGAVSCDPGNPQTLTDSIIVGLNDSCAVTNSVTTMPTLTSTYHLTAHLSCPTAPTTFPDHDIDGDPRAQPIDCGADQFVP